MLLIFQFSYINDETFTVVPEFYDPEVSREVIVIDRSTGKLHCTGKIDAALNMKIKADSTEPALNSFHFHTPTQKLFS